MPSSRAGVLRIDFERFLEKLLRFGGLKPLEEQTSPAHAQIGVLRLCATAALN